MPDSANLPPITDGRSLAVAALLAMFERDGFIRDALADCRPADLPPREVSFATELALGVVQHRPLITRLIAQRLKRPNQPLPRLVYEWLMVGVYQLIWLDRVPDYAAVNAAVDAVKREVGDGPSKMVNGVLRNVQRGVGEAVPLSGGGLKDPRLVPIDATRARRLKEPIVAQKEPPRVLAAVTSHPFDVVAEWVRRFGFERAEAICLHGLSHPRLSLRPTTGTLDALLAELNRRGLEATASDEGTAILRDRPSSEDFAALLSIAQPQDATAAAVVPMANVQPGEVAVDLCAAPGTKTRQLLEAVGDAGAVIACDASPAKRDRLIADFGSSANLRVVSPDDVADATRAMAADRGKTAADVVVVDAPCSNTGVFARRPEAKLRMTTSRIRELAGQQRDLLDVGAALLSEDGRLVYATCALTEAENAQQAGHFTLRSGWSIDREHETLPEQSDERWQDGGYRVMFRR